jgi:hypothetical protein
MYWCYQTFNKQAKLFNMTTYTFGEPSDPFGDFKIIAKGTHIYDDYCQLYGIEYTDGKQYIFSEAGLAFK